MRSSTFTEEEKETYSEPAKGNCKSSSRCYENGYEDTRNKIKCHNNTSPKGNDKSMAKHKHGARRKRPKNPLLYFLFDFLTTSRNISLN